MDINLHFSSQDRRNGSALLTILMSIMVLSILIAAILSLTTQEYRSSMRSVVWENCLHIAEAGIEEGMSHLAQNGTTNLNSQSWTLSNGKYTKTNSIYGGYYIATISTNSPPTITSMGYARIPAGRDYTSRQITITTTAGSSASGINLAIGGKGQIEFDANANPALFVDSYDSTDPNYSTLGAYDASKNKDGGNVGTTSTSAAFTLNASSHILGRAKTGQASGGVSSPNGNSIGSKYWNDHFNDGIETGWLDNNYRQTFPDVTVPTGATTITSVGATLGPGVYQKSSSLTLSQNCVISGNTTLYINGSLNPGSYRFTIPDGAKLTVIITTGGTMTKNPFNNTSGKAANASLWGTPAVTEFNYKPGNNDTFIGTVYMPSASMEWGSGGAGNTLIGAVIGGPLVHFNGGWQVHYDESLNGVGPRSGAASFSVATWAEN